MFDPQRLLGQLLGHSLGGVGRKLGDSNRSLSQMGGMGGFGGGAKLGAGLGLLGVAMAAFEHFKGQPGAPPAPPNAILPPPPPPPPSAPRSLLHHMPVDFPLVGAPHPSAHLPIPEPTPAVLPTAQSAAAMHLLRSMIAAAHADGVLDAVEREAIVGRAREAGLPPDDLMALGAELLAPRALAQLIAETPAGLERETYAAALLAIHLDHAGERVFLQQLAAALHLSMQDQQLIEQQLHS
jgi:hypothetical protein